MIEREVALYAHEVAALRSGTLGLLFRPSTASDEVADKGLEPDITYHHGSTRMKVLKWRGYLARVGGGPQGIVQPLSESHLQQAGFADEASYLRWANLADITTHVYVATVEVLPNA